MTDALRIDFDVVCPIHDAFAVWTQRIGTWWPADHTIGGDPAAVLEGRVGGPKAKEHFAWMERERRGIPAGGTGGGTGPSCDPSPMKRTNMRYCNEGDPKGGTAMELDLLDLYWKPQPLL